MSVRPARRRLLLIVGMVLVVGVGLASRRYPFLLPDFLSSYPGDALWALLVFLCIAFAWPRLASGRLAGAALALAFLVELAQLYQAPWINAIRATTPGHLVLGQGFDWGDLLAYSIGVAAAYLGDIVLARRHAHIL